METQSFSKYHLPREVFFVFLLGFVIRLFACQYTFIVNPDGVLYIHQARAIYYGQWENLTACSMDFLSIYPIFISGAYILFHDWITAARFVSLFFGSITLIPIYLLLKRFFNQEISTLSTLIFALIPVFVDRSADVVRGPIYWFFLVLGLYLFVSQIDKNRYRLYLFLSCLSFLMAAWARIEAVLFIIVSCIYIVATKQEKKIEKFAIFVMPVAFIFLFAIFNLTIFTVSLGDTFRVNGIVNKFISPLVEYGNLRANLTELANHQVAEISQFFLHKARKLVWLIGLGTVFAYIIKAFFYPFSLIFIVGIGGIKSKIKNDQRILYLVLLCIFSMILLYFHVLQTWIMASRFLALFIFPSCIFIGFGLERIIRFLRSRFNLKAPVALLIVGLLILSCALPKNLKPREEDKLVFKDMGDTIARREGNAHKIAVASSLHSIRWVSFYANLKYKGAPCPQEYYDLERLVGDNYREFVQNLKKDGVRYFLWEERHWPQKRFDFIKRVDPKNFIEVGRWTHSDTGRLVLFKVV